MVTTTPVRHSNARHRARHLQALIAKESSGGPHMHLHVSALYWAPSLRLPGEQNLSAVLANLRSHLAHEAFAIGLRGALVLRALVAMWRSRVIECVFRSMPGHDSGRCRPPVPEHAGRVSEAG